jgi:iron complex transport system permease protein
MLSSLVATRSRNAVVLITLGGFLIISVLWSLTIGAVAVPIQDVAIILIQKLGFFIKTPVNEMHVMVMDNIRIPRVAMTVLIGAALGISGAALQGLFRNPLVEPSLIGISGGSACAVVVFVVFGASLPIDKDGWTYALLLPFTAFVGGVVATLVVLTLSMRERKTSIALLILVGVAINALAGAGIGLAIFYADENQLRTFTFWTLGDLGGSTSGNLLIAAPLLTVPVVLLLFFAKPLNALALGESEAYHVGVNVEHVKRYIVLLCALGVGVSVAMAGMIGFVGLIIPHLIRVLFHADNRLVLPASVFGGASLLIIADAIARTIVSPAELPIGVVTALIGSPFFVGLLMKAKMKNQL